MGTLRFGVRWRKITGVTRQTDPGNSPGGKTDPAEKSIIGDTFKDTFCKLTYANRLATWWGKRHR